jgi:ribose/xylose/arabinose/galactoside ABC-type transport system permease subunit
VVSTSSGAGVSTIAYYPSTSTKANGTVLTGCDGLCGTFQYSYATTHLNNTGNWATALFYVLLVGLLCAVAGALIGLFTGLSPAWRRFPTILGFVAMITAIAAPLMWLVALPGAYGKDSQGHTGSGPWSSFFGSHSASGLTTNWAPSFGWYFSLAAFVVLLIGAIWMMRKGSKTA